MWSVDSAGEIDQSAFDDLDKYSTLPQWLRSERNALICRIESTEVNEENGEQIIELGFNEDPNLDIEHVNMVGMQWYLGSVYTILYILESSMR